MTIIISLKTDKCWQIIKVFVCWKTKKSKNKQNTSKKMG